MATNMNLGDEKSRSEEKFWKILEKEMCILVPYNMKIILASKGRANAFGFRKLNEEMLKSYVKDFPNLCIEEGDIDTILGMSEWTAEKLETDKTFFSNYYKRSAEVASLQSDLETFQISKSRRFYQGFSLAENQGNSGTLTMSGTLGVPGTEAVQIVSKINYNGSSLLDLLLQIAERKSDRTDRSFKYPQAVKDVASFLSISGGKALYEFIEHNLPMPSYRSALRYVHSDDAIVEGQMRIHELKCFLQAHNLPLKIWLSDDSTGLISRIRYNKTTNEIVGFVLPLDQNGMPKSRHFLATSAKTIEDFFKYPKCTLLHIIVAQPLAKNAPFFCFIIFGTNDTYDFEVVYKRWHFIHDRLQKEGIQVVGQSTDGDSRAFKVMRIKSGLLHGNVESSCGIPEFKAHLRPSGPVYMQDTVHIGAKLLNRLGKASIILAMGEFVANLSHLKLLIREAPKDEHHLTFKDLYSNDKMNFERVLRMCHPRVIKCLETYIIDSEGTQKYLKLIQMVLYSVLIVDLSTEKRVYALWYSVFFLRLWRAWLLKHEIYSIEHNFITLNSYICIEINAHGMYNMILRHIDSGSFEDFFPHMYSSQPCESYFRLLRSFTPTFSTMVNCDLLEALYKVKKVEHLVKVSNSANNQSPINYPRKSQFRSSFDQLNLKDFGKETTGIPEDLPSINEKHSTLDQKLKAETNMQKILKNAKAAAFNDIKKLGIDVDIAEANDIQVKVKKTDYENRDTNIESQNVCIETDIDEINEDEEQDEAAESNHEGATHEDSVLARSTNCEYENEEIDEAVDDDFMCTCNNSSSDAKNDSGNIVATQLELDGLHSNFDLPEVSDKFIKTPVICKNCPYTYVKNKDGKNILVWKSSIVWLLNKGETRVSADRLARFRSSKRKTEYYELRESNEIKAVTEHEKIFIGDWCLFRDDENPSDTFDTWIVGFILHFAKNFGDNIKRPTWKKIEYNKNYVDITSNNNCGTLCQWYVINFNTQELEKLEIKTHGYTEVSNYRAHVPHPILKCVNSEDSSIQRKLYVTSEICNQIKNKYGTMNKE